MSGKQDQVLMKIKDPLVRDALHYLEVELKKLFKEKAPVILLYGSFARGQSTPESDVDLLLLFPNAIRPSAEIRRISGILADINLRYQVLISIVPTTKHQYLHAQEPFWNNVRREGVPITTV
jgi:predicted nucleotidyltransferase